MNETNITVTNEQQLVSVDKGYKWQTRLDNKHSAYVDPIDGMPKLAKRLETGALVPIPEDEPTIIFRGRDRLAVHLLDYYRTLCEFGGATDYQLASIDDMIEKFKKFAEGQPKTMKMPSATRGM